MFIHMIGTYYIMNLMLVMLMESYIEKSEIHALDDINDREKETKKFEASKMPNGYRDQVSYLLNFVTNPGFKNMLENCSFIAEEPSKDQEAEAIENAAVISEEGPIIN